MSRECSALHFDYEQALLSLSAEERRKGSAIRIPRCVRGIHENEIAWVILYFCKEFDKDAFPYTKGFSALFASKSMMFGPLVRTVGSDQCEDVWYVSEFEIVLPLALRMFTIACGDASVSVSWKERSRLLDRHYEEISHSATDLSYSKWFDNHLRKSSIPEFTVKPLMSIVTPVYRTPPLFLSDMINSILRQSYENWELILVNASPDDEDVLRVLSSYDDNRIRIIDHPENNGISGNTNVGIAASKGDYISFLDHDDIVEVDALALMVKAINEAEDRIDLLYCDEDSIDEHGDRCCPLFKPASNLDLLYSNNYVIHWLTVSRGVIDAVDRSGRDVDGAQDYDLTLKVFEVSKNIVRIPYVLYHWRIHAGSTNLNPDSKPYAQLAGARAIEDHFCRSGLRAGVSLEDIPCTYKSIFDVIPDSEASIACITKSRLVSNVFKAESSKYEKKVDFVGTVRRLAGDDSDQVKQALLSIDESLVFFCPDSVYNIDVNTLSIMAGYFQRSDVAAVSPKLIRKDGLIDYAGICMCPNGDVMYMNRFLPASDGGYVGRAQRPYDSFLLNPDCFMVRKDILENYLNKIVCQDAVQWKIGLFAECFKESLRCVYTPFACLYDSEHKTLLDYGLIGLNDEHRSFFTNQYESLIIEGDPSHNPNFDPYSPYYRLC